MNRRSPTRVAAVMLVSALMLLSIGWLARAPYTPRGSEDALLRLSWRFRPVAEETCRPRTQSELDALPVHMRTPEVCDKESVVYRVIRQLDDGPADTIRVLRGGLRQDRPVYVMLDTALVPGMHRVRAELTRERDGVTPEQVLAPLDTVVDLGAGHIGLVTLDGTGRVLILRTPAD